MNYMKHGFWNFAWNTGKKSEEVKTSDICNYL